MMRESVCVSMYLCHCLCVCACLPRIVASDLIPFHNHTRLPRIIHPTEIPSAKRWVAARLYGPLPVATYDEALGHFEQATGSTVPLSVALWTAKTHLALGSKARVCYCASCISCAVLTS